MEETLIDMREKKLFKKLAGWRNEHYYVRTKFSEKPLFSIERSAATTFGISSYGCHINGYIKRNGEYLMWIARRSKTKPTYPGKLDNFVAGGLTAGLSPSECATKELEEEAGLVGNELVKRLKQVDSISYAFDNKGLVNREGEFVFDIKLPEDFVPQNTDGEVECFYLMNIDQVMICYDMICFHMISLFFKRCDKINLILLRLKMRSLMRTSKLTVL
jgi:isopentenyldiphosphate isomerase